MHNIGNEEDARTILDWVRSSQKRRFSWPKCVDTKEGPDGWTFLGRGSFRSVWLSPEGVVYKVNHEDDWDEQSADEVDTLSRVWDVGPLEGCRLPKFNWFQLDEEIVVVMEWVKGWTLWEYNSRENDCDKRSEYTSLMRRIAVEYAVGDMHDENVMVDKDGYLVPVDFGG